MASSISRFFPSTWVFCVVSWPALVSSSSLARLSSSCCCLSSSSDARSVSACFSSRVLVSRSSSCWVVSSPASDCDCLSSDSVRMLASIVLSTIAIVSVIWSSRLRWISLKWWNEASSMTALTSPSKMTGSTTMLIGVASPSPEPMRM